MYKEVYKRKLPNHQFKSQQCKPSSHHFSINFSSAFTTEHRIAPITYKQHYSWSHSRPQKRRRGSMPFLLILNCGHEMYPTATNRIFKLTAIKVMNAQVRTRRDSRQPWWLHTGFNFRETCSPIMYWMVAFTTAQHLTSAEDWCNGG